MTVIYVYVLLLIATWPCVTALRGHTPADYKFADALWTKAALPEVTSYGQPVGELLAKPTSVDHFGSVQYTRNDTYELRYALIWPVDAPNASTPIFLFCAQESPITSVAPGSGFYSSLANSTAALQIWPEHRYYAEAEPYTPADDFAHFTIEQSLVDHIELVLYVQNVYNLTTNPVIAIGSSYSGQLSQYLRIRYPDVIAGAISSSPTSFGCPGLGLDPSYDPYGFAKVATRAASSEGGSADACPSNVQDFFQTIFSLANTLDGLNQINTDMQLCSDSQVSSYDQVNGTLAQYVQGQWVSAAQYNAPIANVGTLGVPAYRVRVASAPEAAPANTAQPELSSSQKFSYQVCNQDQTPTSFDGVTDMFYDLPFSLDSNDEQCLEQFGIHAQYNWAAYNFGLSAIRQSSNIFFTNGIYDPFIACGPTVNISATITVAVHEGCHAYDVGPAMPEDPPSVTAARNQGAALIAQWVKEYNSMQTQLPTSNAANMFQLKYALGGYTQVVNDTLPGSESLRNQTLLEPSAEVDRLGKTARILSMARFASEAKLETFLGRLDPDYSPSASTLWQQGVKTAFQLANARESILLACGLSELYIDDIKARADRTGGMSLQADEARAKIINCEAVDDKQKAKMLLLINTEPDTTLLVFTGVPDFLLGHTLSMHLEGLRAGSVAALGGIASDRQVAQRLLMFPLQQAPANAIAFEHFLYNAQFQLPVSARPFQLIQTHDPGLANILYLCHDCLIRAAVSDALQLSELGIAGSTERDTTRWVTTCLKVLEEVDAANPDGIAVLLRFNSSEKDVSTLCRRARLAKDLLEWTQ
ncbi:hypothetical protein WJX79_009826 [Trebouxia sp. C0005]